MIVGASSQGGHHACRGTVHLVAGADLIPDESLDPCGQIFEEHEGIMTRKVIRGFGVEMDRCCGVDS